LVALATIQAEDPDDLARKIEQAASVARQAG
jgi:hypothetical protein